MSTVVRGPLLAATDTSTASSAMSASASAAGSAATDMVPRPATRSRISRARRQTTAAASARLRAPATQAAADSPMLCPMTTSGSTPQARQVSARETWTAQSTGCTTATVSPTRSLPSVSRSMTDQPVSLRTTSSQRIRAALNAVEVSMSSRAMPIHWEPWPEKTNATCGRPA